jgi:hypothetical protein
VVIAIGSSQHLPVDARRERTKAKIPLQLEHVLTARRVATMQILVECRWINAQLTCKHGQDLWVSLLADTQDTTWVARIAKLHGEAQLRRGTPVAADQPQIVVRERVETGQGAVIEASGKFGELGPLGRCEQLAGGHGG